MIRSLVALSLIISGVSMADGRAYLEQYVGPNSFEPGHAEKRCRVAITDAATIAKIRDAIANPEYRVYSQRGGHHIMVGPTIAYTAHLGDRSVDLVRNTDTMNLLNTSASARDLQDLAFKKCN